MPPLCVPCLLAFRFALYALWYFNEVPSMPCLCVPCLLAFCFAFSALWRPSVPFGTLTRFFLMPPLLYPLPACLVLCL